jgi:nitrogen regulatory protein P-II 1
MKLVTAIINSDMLDDVREALIQKDISRITVSRCSGRGRAERVDLYRGQELAPDLVPKVRVDIACNNEFLDLTIEAILSAAKKEGGTVGDGKIFVTELQECIRIRTGERGHEAI